MSEDTFFCIRCARRKPHSMLANIVAGRRTCKTCDAQKMATIKRLRAEKAVTRSATGSQ